MTDDEQLELKEIVTVFRSGGGEVITIPVKVRKEFNIKTGDRFALYIHKKTNDFVLRKLE